MTALDGHPSGFSTTEELDDFNAALNTEPDALEQAELADVRTDADGQIDLFTGGTPTVTEYGARHRMFDGDTITVGPFSARESAERAGAHNVANHGGSFEIVERRTTVWEPIAR